MPCFRFSYSACCLFPFVPPGFAPTAVPPVLPFFSAFASLPGFSACLPLSFVRFGLLLTTQPSVFLFPSSRLPLTAVPSVRSGFLRPLCFPLSIPVLSFLRFPFSARCFVSQALHSRRPPVSSSAAPLAFALGSGYLALSFRVLVPRSDLTYISTASSNCQHLFFIFFNYYLVNYYHFYVSASKTFIANPVLFRYTIPKDHPRRTQQGYGVEPMLRLLSGDRTYCETHNAVLDAVDELGIMRLLKRQLEEYQAL